MARKSIPEVVIRTTSDGDGYPHGIAVGVGYDPAGALADLGAAAERLVMEAIGGTRLRLADMPGPDDWGIEVVDVRLLSADPSAPYAWTAYGTLRTTGLSPLMPQDDL